VYPLEAAVVLPLEVEEEECLLAMVEVFPEAEAEVLQGAEVQVASLFAVAMTAQAAEMVVHDDV